MPKYLMLDHGGVLDGDISVSSPKKNDLLLEKYAWGGYRLIKNGVQLVKDLHELVYHYDYQLVFHSKNQKNDQINVYKDLKMACFLQEIQLPPIYAMAVCDPYVYRNVDSLQPILTYDNKHDIRVAGYGVELEGKTCVRQALSSILHIAPNDRSQHIIFDDGESVINAARTEGYQAYLIGTGNNRIELADAVAMLCQQFTKQIANQDTPTISQYTTFNKVNTYQGLPIEFRQYLSETTQLERHCNGHISTENYWTQLNQATKDKLRQKWEKKTDQHESTLTPLPFSQMTYNLR
jgi:hypothetical protein